MEMECRANGYKVKNQNKEWKLYKRRWLILLIFIFYAIAAGIQWPEFSVIKSMIMRYYGVSHQSVEWTMMVYMICYTIEIIPATYVMDKMGIRNSLIIAGAGSCIGSWIKVFSVASNRFHYVMIGQIVSASSTVMTFGLAARIAASWFGSKEIALANALALFGDEFGNAVGFVLPEIFVNVNDIELFEKGLFKLNLIIAVMTTIAIILIFMFVKTNPKKPPSVAQVIKGEMKAFGFKESMKTLMTKTFLLVLFSYAVNLGGAHAISVMMETLILTNFENNRDAAGVIGFLFMVFGMVGTVAAGYILDKTRQYKWTGVFVTGCSFINMLLLTYFLKAGSLITVYFFFCLQGVFLIGYSPIGVQLGIETTYPLSEAISSGAMIFTVEITALITTNIYSFVMVQFGDVAANEMLCCILLLSVVLIAIAPNTTKRQDAEKAAIKREENILLSG